MIPSPDDAHRAVAGNDALPYPERLAALESLAAPTEADTLLRGDCLRFLGRIDESEACFLALSEAGGVSSAAARLGLALARAARAEWAGARELLTSLLREPATDPSFRARVYGTLASTWFNDGDLAAAETALGEALRIQRAHRDRRGEAVSVTSLGIVAFSRGDVPRAFSFLEEGRAGARRAGVRHWEAMAGAYLALVRHVSGDLDEAAALYAASLAALEATGVRRAGALTLLGRGVLHLERGDVVAAEDDLREALSEKRATSPDYEPLLAALLAVAAAARGDRRGVSYQLDFARASLRERGPRFAAVVAAVDSAVVRGEPPALSGSIEAQLVGRVLGRNPAAARTLAVGPDAGWFSVDGAPRVELFRRENLRRLLDVLTTSPAGLSVPELVRAGWPGERVLPEAGATRVYTAIATLRRMGLAEVLVRRGEGYGLAAGVVVER